MLQSIPHPHLLNGYVYTGADDGNVYCLNAATGSLVWKVAIPAGVAANFGFGSVGTQGPPSPMIVGNDLYIGDNNYIYCLDANTGATIWSYTWGNNGGKPAPLIGTPTIVNNIVFIAPDTGDGSVGSSGTSNPNGFLYELDAQTGTLITNITIPYVENPFKAAG